METHRVTWEPKRNNGVLKNIRTLVHIVEYEMLSQTLYFVTTRYVTAIEWSKTLRYTQWRIQKGG